MIADRPEQHPGCPGDQVEEGELHADHPQPRPRPELGPALGHVAQQAPAPLAGGFGCPRRPGPAEQAKGEHARGERRRVRRHHHGGPGEGHEDSAQRGARDPGRRGGQPEQRVRVAELILRRDLHGQRAQGRREERLPGPLEPGEQDEQPERRPPREQRGGQAGLRGAAEHVRGEHDPAPPEAVGDRPGERQHHHLGHDPGREDESEAGRPAAALQDRPGDRHRGHRRAEQGCHVAGVEPAEVAFPQHARLAP
jgi:hypothetical protein